MYNLFMLFKKWSETTKNDKELFENESLNRMAKEIDFNIFGNNLNTAALLVRGFLETTLKIKDVFREKRGDYYVIKWSDISKIENIFAPHDKNYYSNLINEAHHNDNFYVKTYSIKEIIDIINFLLKITNYISAPKNSQILIDENEVILIDANNKELVIKTNEKICDFIIKNAKKIFIPVYQRGFVYGYNEIHDIIKSINHKDFYFGVIHINIRDGKYVIMDGKQRVLTFIMLMIVSKQVDLSFMDEIDFISTEEKNLILNSTSKINDEVNYGGFEDDSLLSHDEITSFKEKSFISNLNKSYFKIIFHQEKDEIQFFLKINTPKEMERKDIDFAKGLNRLKKDLVSDDDYKHFNELITDKFDSVYSVIKEACYFMEKAELNYSNVVETQYVVDEMMKQKEADPFDKITSLKHFMEIIEFVRKFDSLDIRKNFDLADEGAKFYKLLSIGCEKFKESLELMDIVNTTYIVGFPKIKIINELFTRGTINEEINKLFNSLHSKDFNYDANKKLIEKYTLNEINEYFWKKLDVGFIGRIFYWSNILFPLSYKESFNILHANNKYGIDGKSFIEDIVYKFLDEINEDIFKGDFKYIINHNIEDGKTNYLFCTNEIYRELLNLIDKCIEKYRDSKEYGNAFNYFQKIRKHAYDYLINNNELPKVKCIESLNKLLILDDKTNKFNPDNIFSFIREYKKVIEGIEIESLVEEKWVKYKKVVSNKLDKILRKRNINLSI